MSDVASTKTAWTCTASPPGDLTVGQPFEISCAGDSVAMKAESLGITELGDQKYHLKLTSIKSADDRHIEATVVSYKPGVYGKDGGKDGGNDGPFFLSDGTNSVELRGLTFEVHSVIPKGEKPEAFPAFPFWEMGFPWWFWVLSFYAVALPLLGIFLWARKAAQLKKLRQELERHRTVRPPFDEFHRELRLLERKHGVEPTDPKLYVQELNRVFRMFLVRELIVPALDWSDRAVLKEIKKRHRVLYDDLNGALAQVMRELNRAQSVASVNVGDAQQLAKMARETSESVFRVQARIAAKGRK